jgi:mevalonate kinase
MLLGEYGVILGSRALTIPFTHFTGELSLIHDEKYTDIGFALESNQQLRQYYGYLTAPENSGMADEILDIERLGRELAVGLYFESGIPQGYGIGSSGALVAAIYGRFARNAIVPSRELPPGDILRLKEVFASMESFFHGRSSGIDPLNAYLKFPLHYVNQEEIVPVGIPRQKFEGQAAVFLVDTKQTGKTDKYVRQFLESCSDEAYLGSIQNTYIPLVNACIDDLLEGDTTGFFDHIKELSVYQLHHFGMMIPVGFRQAWEEGNRAGSFYWKLCGSGGGGFILGFTSDFLRATRHLQKFGMVPVPVYQTRISSVVSGNDRDPFLVGIPGDD